MCRNLPHDVPRQLEHIFHWTFTVITAQRSSQEGQSSLPRRPSPVRLRDDHSRQRRQVSNRVLWAVGGPLRFWESKAIQPFSVLKRWARKRNFLVYRITRRRLWY
ncbi:hypothetical protein A0H81_03874 [Grifola frondosa]|uniref:Uncharacterized protein n=1 Tax=Grifola frondosa TaxID=5627 RepID=A0A1C7MIA2_GRIFR|nr:hypothetical protein A0H81_03874 [Grifola frondosa]